jgi:precorrin-2 dehydrogenase/sirohydrochlorin ferrochelatase
VKQSILSRAMLLTAIFRRGWRAEVGSKQKSRSRLFPVFLKLRGRPAVVVGAGPIGEGKIRGLLATGARIRVIAIRATAAVRAWAARGDISLYERAFVPADLDSALIAVAATGSRELNEQIFRECRARGVLCNVVDVPGLCDFYYPAVVRRGDLQIAVSTSGQSPSLARRIREQLEKQYGPDYARWVTELGRTRRRILNSDLEATRKRELLTSLAGLAAFEAAVAAIREKEGSMT